MVPWSNVLIIFILRVVDYFFRNRKHHIDSVKFFFILPPRVEFLANLKPPHLFSFLISIEAAVAAFSQARAPGIYKGDYLKELFSRYGDEEDTPPPPALPEWCFDDDDGEVDDDGNAVGQESGPSSSGSAPGKRKKEKLKLVRGSSLADVLWCWIVKYSP